MTIQAAMEQPAKGCCSSGTSGDCLMADLIEAAAQHIMHHHAGTSAHPVGAMGLQSDIAELLPPVVLPLSLNTSW